MRECMHACVHQHCVRVCGGGGMACACMHAFLFVCMHVHVCVP